MRQSAAGCSPGSCCSACRRESSITGRTNLLFRNFSSSSADQKKISIQDANLLQLRVTYWYPLYVPLINRMISSFICCKEGETCRWGGDPACDADDPHIPLTAVAAIRMQTPARESVGYSESSGSSM